MATYSSILAWKIPWREEPGGPRGRKESDTTERLNRIETKIYLPGGPAVWQEALKRVALM